MKKKNYLKLCVELFQGNVCYIETRGRQTKPVRVFLFFQNREFVLFSSGKSKRELFFTSVSGGFFSFSIHTSGLPELAFLFLSRNFNNSRFVNDTRGALSFFHDSDNPGLVSFLLFDVFAVSCSLFPGKADEETTRRFAECPCKSWNILPQALATAAILAMTGKL